MATRDDKDNLSFEKIGNEWTRKVKPISTGSILEGISFDYIAATYPTASSEVYTYKTGGVSGTTVATITVTYADSTKEVLSSVVRS